MIELQDVSKSYGGVKAVDGVTLQVPKGQILGFLGPNGAGKTTTMRMITGFMPPTAGTIVVDGQSMEDHSLAIREKIGYLPEMAPVYQDMNVLDYLHYVCALRRIPQERRNTRIKEVVDRCGLTTVLGKEVGQLSKGYRQRVGLAQAIIHDPQYLILDEPTAGLDPNQIVEIRALIKELGREKTVILSTHILSEVQATCSRVIIISGGKLVADNTPDGLQASLSGRNVLLLTLKGNVGDAAARLKAVPSIEDVRPVPTGKPGESKFRIESTPGTDIREDVFILAVAERWTVLEMIPETQSLEEVFHKLTAA
ncbi:MAG: ATP-binding cassette domain-containing protein [Calditrichaeota bacterium]|nr:ATP-binding cassette domain-containing protein [Calditrichota bacterium]MCB9366748.1 ATP-binding cassette domain-containing protein [Calditrichota bacterium]